MTSEPTDQRERIEERATAFVFGELERDEATEFMKAMDASSSLRSLVTSIRDAVGALQTEFEDSTGGVNDADREKIELAINASQVQAPPFVMDPADTSSRRWATGLAVAASLLLACGLTFPALNQVITANTDTSELRDKIREIELRNKQLENEKRAIEQELASLRSSAQADPGAENTRSEAQSQSAASDSNPQTVAAPGEKVGSEETTPPNLPARNTSNGNDSPTEDTSSEPTQPDRSLDTQDFEIDTDDGSILDPDDPSELGVDPLEREGEGLAEIANAGEIMSEAELMMEMEKGMEMMAGDAPRNAGFGGGSGHGIGGLGTTPRQFARFAPFGDNSFVPVNNAPLSTFAIDVDTAAYNKIRSSLSRQHRLPNSDSVHIEELVNFFSYDYLPPDDDRPFAAAIDVAGCPWNPEHRLARIGIKGKEIKQDRPASNIVFLLDVSGSMNRPNRMPLVVDAIKMLVNQLDEKDSIAIVVYAGAAGLVLDSTTGDRKKTIFDSLEKLKSGGPTDGGRGIQLAYRIARDSFIAGGTNRVVLCSDGDLNVGMTNTDQLIQLAEENSQAGILLSVLGFGMEKNPDETMKQIRNRSDGDYALIDNQDQARKVFVEQINGTLETIAQDVELQVEFNPMEVESYRLIGYENGILAAEDFNHNTIGAGHTVTAFYEIVPKRDLDPDTTGVDQFLIDRLKYQRPIRYSEEAASGEMLTLRLSYKSPSENESQLIEFAVKDTGKRFNLADHDFQFAASVAAFGMLMRNSPHKGSSSFDMVEEMATSSAIDDRSGYRNEFLSLVKTARALSGE